MKKPSSKQPAKPATIHISSLPQREREALRLRLFELWEKGVSAEQAAAEVHVKPITVKKNYSRFETEGRDGAYEKPHGFALLVQSSQDRGAEDALVAAIAAGAPGDNAPGHALWSLTAVTAFYRERFGRDIDRDQASGILRRLGFVRTQTVPSKRIKAFREWERENIKEIRAMARKYHALVAWVDETLQTPVSSNTLKYNRGSDLPADLAHRRKALTAMFLTGETFFLGVEGDLTPEIFRSFVEGLQADQADRPLVLLMEDRGWLWSNEMTAWRKQLRDAGKLWIRCYPRLHRPPLVKSPKRPRASLEDILAALH